MRGLTPLERDLLSAPPETEHSESEWLATPALVALGRARMKVRCWSDDEFDYERETVIPTELGLLALRVCLVGEP